MGVHLVVYNALGNKQVNWDVCNMRVHYDDESALRCMRVPLEHWILHERA